MATIFYVSFQDKKTQKFCLMFFTESGRICYRKRTSRLSRIEKALGLPVDSVPYPFLTKYK